MKLVTAPRKMVLILLLSAGLLSFISQPTAAQGWKPERPFEIVVGCAPGCGPDVVARMMQRVFQTQRYFEPPMTIQNKGGGMGAVLRTYLKQFEGNGHYLYHGDQGVLAAHAIGRSAYTDFTPVAILFGEYIGIAVKADSPIKSGRDLIERLQKNPTAASFGIATSVGNINHQGVAGALKSAGIDVRKTRNVIFDSGALAITALLGGHIDAVPVSVGSWEPHMKTSAVRVIAVSANERLPGFFASIPTWREQGAESVVFNWRAMFGPKGMTAAQVTYWENIFQRLIDTPEWKAEMALRSGVTQFVRAAPMKKRMDDEYTEIKALLVDLELAKK